MRWGNRSTAEAKLNQEFGPSGPSTPTANLTACPDGQVIVGFTTATYLGGINYIDVNPRCSQLILTLHSAYPVATAVAMTS